MNMVNPEGTRTGEADFWVTIGHSRARFPRILRGYSAQQLEALKSALRGYDFSRSLPPLECR